MKSQSLIFIKPDCANKPEFIIELCWLISNLGLRMIAFGWRQKPEAFWREFYAEHATRPDFPDYDGFIKWLASTKLPFFIVEGEGPDVPALVRRQVVDVLRLNWQTSQRMNALHASDSTPSFKRERALFQRAA